VLIVDATADVAGRFRAPRKWIAALLAGSAVGIFASRLGVSVADLATAAAAVREQQVALGRWARAHLPPGSIVGVNDTGAIAYFGWHPTFDIVGLTTRGEAAYWTAGPGSRFEHYERLPAGERPSFFIVYPEWFAIPPLLGERLTERTVRHTILGGSTMGAYRARYGALGSAERPLDPGLSDGALVDVLDVADLESEALHEYALFDAVQVDNAVIERGAAVDGGRRRRSRDRFRIRLAPGGTLVMRLGSDEPQRVSVRVDGQTIAAKELNGAPWLERAIRLPDGLSSGEHTVDVVAGEGTVFTAMHYWALR
jgi:hypothetical protein